MNCEFNVVKPAKTVVKPAKTVVKISYTVYFYSLVFIFYTVYACDFSWAFELQYEFFLGKVFLSFAVSPRV